MTNVDKYAVWATCKPMPSRNSLSIMLLLTPQSAFKTWR
jgi:hypothetical protein